MNYRNDNYIHKVAIDQHKSKHNQTEAVSSLANIFPGQGRTRFVDLILVIGFFILHFIIHGNIAVGPCHFPLLSFQAKFPTENHFVKPLQVIWNFHVVFPAIESQSYNNSHSHNYSHHEVS